MPLSADQVLARALAAAFAEHGAAVFVEAVDSRPWASVTFSGERHGIGVRLIGANAERAADAVLPGLGEREFTLPGHVLIDIALERVERDGDDLKLRLGALTIEAD